jgi:hypothetical protein
MTAILAAASVCGAGAVLAVALAGTPAAAQTTDINTENGVHAAPSGDVGSSALGNVGAKVAVSAMPEKLSVQIADAGPAPLATPGPLAVPAPIAAPAPLAVPPPPQPAVEELADAAPEGGSEEDAVYRRTPAPVARPAADVAQDTPATLTKVSDVESAQTTPMRQHVAFPRSSAEAATAFDGYMHAVAAIDAGFKSGQGVQAALKRASAYDPHQLEEGMIAYGAMAAMQSPRFVYGVMDIAGNDRDRQALIDALVADPETAARLPGATDASALASNAILVEARPVVRNGRAIKQASYDVQHQAWSIIKATDQSGRLAEAKAESATRTSAHEGDVARLLSQVSTLNADSRLGEAAASPVVDHSLALAALAILDGTQGADEGRLEPVISERVSAECLKLAKLNLFQCLSVAGPEYEDVYCLGQHAVLDTGQCVAGGAAPAEAVLVSDASARPNRPE